MMLLLESIVPMERLWRMRLEMWLIQWMDIVFNRVKWVKNWWVVFVCTCCVSATDTDFQQIQYAKAKAAASKPDKRQQNLNEIVQLSSQLSEKLQLMRVLQETLVVPAISVVVPSKSQKSFNNRVLLKLGVLESRVHLVGMHDAVWESHIESEKAKFETEIPYVARMMIERWRRSLYNPKAEMLDYGLSDR
jgi:hypothetical protein